MHLSYVLGGTATRKEFNDFKKYNGILCKITKWFIKKGKKQMELFFN